MMNEVYKVVNGTSYHSDTPDSLVQALEQARLSRTRVCVTYDGEGDSRSGYVSRSCGSVKIPLLVFNSRGRGGECIFERLVLEVRTSRGKALLWKRA